MYIICKLSIQNGFSYFLQNIPTVQGKNVFLETLCQGIHSSSGKKKEEEEKTKKPKKTPKSPRRDKQSKKAVFLNWVYKRP